jgi:hypothetical protein
MKSLLFFLFLLSSCGSDSSSDNPAPAPVTSQNPLAESQGQPGAKGEKGDSGPAGKDGKDGTAGKDARPVESNMWLDGITSRYWLVGGRASYVDADTKTCSNGWRLATKDEVALALTRGLRSKLTVNTAYWTSTDSPIAMIPPFTSGGSTYPGSPAEDGRVVLQVVAAGESFQEHTNIRKENLTGVICVESR